MLLHRFGTDHVVENLLTQGAVWGQRKSSRHREQGGGRQPCLPLAALAAGSVGEAVRAAQSPHLRGVDVQGNATSPMCSSAASNRNFRHKQRMLVKTTMSTSWMRTARKLEAALPPSVVPGYSAGRGCTWLPPRVPTRPWGGRLPRVSRLSSDWPVLRHVSGARKN